MRAGSVTTRGRASAGPIAAWLVLLLAVLWAWPAASFPEIGYLQFRVDHNLGTPACLAAGTCFLEFEDFNTPAAWLSEIRGASNLPTLHWDRGIPWLAFDVDLPAGGDREAFYDARLDAETVAWLAAFKDHFALLGGGYLAVSLLDGPRRGYAPLHLGQQNTLPVGSACPDFSPGTQVVVDPGTGPESFDLARSYRNFVLYLAAKLGPRYLALVVEANLIEASCPARADGLYALYRQLHDEVEASLVLDGQNPLIFATLSLPSLLAYTRESCYPNSSFLPCGASPGQSPPNAGEESCYPMAAGAIDSLNLGDRLDVLALSFYPDSLEMNPVATEDLETRAFELPAWNAGGACEAALAWPDAFDPMGAIDRLGWTGPIAIAETSARSCASPLRIDLPGTPPLEYVFEIAGSPSAEAAWLEHTFTAALERDALFYVHSFLRDYEPVGVWTADQNVLPQEIQQLVNLWPCSGIQDASGQVKPEVAAIGLPEPRFGTLLAVGCASFAAFLSIRPRTLRFR